jgi:hypothetical protein
MAAWIGDGFMRTELDIDDDVLAIANQLAVAHNTTCGKVISALARQALSKPVVVADLSVRNGFMCCRAGAESSRPNRSRNLEPQFCLETGLWNV